MSVRALSETRRLAALRLYRGVESAASCVLDQLVRRVERDLDAPIACVSLIDGKRIRGVAHVGLPSIALPREASFGRYTILSDEPFIVEDALRDPRFSDNPQVTGAPYVRSYAGAPLVNRDGARIGTACVADTRRRAFSAEELAKIVSFARLSMIHLDLLGLKRTHGYGLGDYLRYSADQAQAEHVQPKVARYVDLLFAEMDDRLCAGPATQLH